MSSISFFKVGRSVLRKSVLFALSGQLLYPKISHNIINPWTTWCFTLKYQNTQRNPMHQRLMPEMWKIADLREVTGQFGWSQWSHFDTFDFFILNKLLNSSKLITYVLYRCKSIFISVLANVLPFVLVFCHVNKFNDTSSSSFEPPQFISIHVFLFL